MFEVNEKSTHKEILLSLWGRPRYEVTTICVLLNRMGHDIPNYLSKERMLEYLSDIDKEDLLHAVEIFEGEQDVDEEENEDDEDDEFDDDEEDVEDSDHD